MSLRQQVIIFSYETIIWKKIASNIIVLRNTGNGQWARAAILILRFHDIKTLTVRGFYNS